MMSLCVLSATFCATQYNKQKNLIEDYAYKTVLSKSFIAFAEELKKHDEAAYGSMVQLFNQSGNLRCSSHPRRKLNNPEVAEVNRRTFRLQAEVTLF
jgi:hypothetical protein